MGLQLHETVYGKNFFEYQLPKLTEAIENLSENIKRQKDKLRYRQGSVPVCTKFRGIREIPSTDISFPERAVYCHQR